MTEVGRRPTLEDIIEAISAICEIEAAVSAAHKESETFQVILTFNRSLCPLDWQEGLPKPTWLIDEALEQLKKWKQHKSKEEQWVSKEAQFGSSIDGLIVHYTDVLKNAAATVPETFATRHVKRMSSETILRLKELKERREAGGVYSQTHSRREKARKTWAEDEYEAPKREKEQAQQRYNYQSPPEWNNRAFREAYGDALEKLFEEAMYGRGDPFRQPPPKPSSGNKQPWHTVLRVPINASKDDIKKAHRKLVKQYQPRTSADAEDRTRTERMMEINTARDEGLGGLS